MQITFNDITIEIPHQALMCFHSNEQHGLSGESGGILLGKKLLNAETYIITSATLPNVKDLSGPSFFVRNKEASQTIIEDYWNSSGGIINYLGEWHTHRCKRPIPSSTDKKLIQQIIADKVSPFDLFLMIIVGQNYSLYIEVIDHKNNKRYSKQINYKELMA